MRRTMIVCFALSLLLAWAGTAMAQDFYRDGAGAPTRGDCGFGTGDRVIHQLTFPYFAESPDFWNGMAIINTTMAQIPPAAICIKAKAHGLDPVTLRGSSIPALVANNGITGTGMFVTLMETLAQTNPYFNNRLTLAVYTNRSNNWFPGSLRGFGMMGTATQGQGYLALVPWTLENPIHNWFVIEGAGERGGSTLFFDYIPEAPDFFSGIALFNTRNRTVTATVDILYENGNTILGQTLSLGAYQLWTGDVRNLLPAAQPYRTNTRAMIRIRTATSDGAAENHENHELDNHNQLVGFAYFTNGNLAQGGLPVLGRRDAPRASPWNFDE